MASDFHVGLEKLKSFCCLNGCYKCGQSLLHCADKYCKHKHITKNLICALACHNLDTAYNFEGRWEVCLWSRLT